MMPSPGAVHILPQPQRLWPTHLIPDGVAIATNANPALGGKVILQGASGVDFLGTNVRGKVNANLILSPGVGGFGSSNVHNTAFQALAGPSVPHMEVRYSSKCAEVLML